MKDPISLALVDCKVGLPFRPQLQPISVTSFRRGNVDPSTKLNPFMHCVLRGSAEILIARPAIEIQPDGEDRRFILQTECDQFPNVRRTMQIGWIVSTTDGTVLDAISNFEFHEKYQVRIPERSKGLEYYG